MPTPVKTEPTKIDERLVYLVGLGYTSLRAGEKMGLSRDAVRQRIRSLKTLTKTETQAHLVHWMLNDYRIAYYRRGRGNPFDDLYTDIIQHIAWGWDDSKICKKFYISSDGFKSRVRDARLKVRARSQAQLVAIAWTEDWII